LERLENKTKLVIIVSVMTYEYIPSLLPSRSLFRRSRIRSLFTYFCNWSNVRHGLSH
jgi:hypothetical protein